MVKVDKKQEKVSLVKINSSLYEAIRATVGENSIEFPSIKHFIEKASMQALGFKKYNIEGVEDQNFDGKKLSQVVGESETGFVFCLACNRAFLKEKGANNDAAKICPQCKKAILHLSKILKGENKNGR
jgi:formylmethanofuran dehydrogenase subunit E